ncbi:MAG: quinolinate synthase NadA [Acidobacteria bacterium]|nr:quinolinate synthase NadA [Acidobacteriota bacterium]MSO62778.1 quinolinate synthase NadA [Acidobacteriota bacterium]
MSTFLPILNEVEKASIHERQPLPAAYLGLPDDEMALRIEAARAALGERLVILGHHYQRDEVIRFADYTGDSFKLAGAIANHPRADYIVFCGVHFMAESADILARPHQRVILPDLAAGCSMADMAPADQLEICWNELRQMGIAERTVPVTYINSAAAIKSLVGQNGGTVCTSSNAGATLKWGWQQKEKILFLPDQHLGRNTAYKMGVSLDRMVVWDPHEPFGGLTRDQLDQARLILWKGHCSVHVRFTAKQIDQVRREHPGIKVIVHPEVPFDVLQAADDSGSTEHILNTVRNSPAGSTWAVGTEVHLVHRLAEEVAPGKTVVSLDQFGCLCSTMFRVSPNHLLWVLDSLVDGDVVNEIVVPEEQKKWAKIALDRMLSIQ